MFGHSTARNGRRLLAAAAAFAVVTSSGCDSASLQAFRGGSSGALQTGAQDIASGLINGGFAVYGLGATPSNANPAGATASGS